MLTVLYVIGITAEAMTAALAAGRQRMDLFGVSMIACVTALGGGTVRDMLLGHYPLRWVSEPIFLVIVVTAALITVLASFLMDYFRTIFLLADAVGLAVFSVLGAQVALSGGHGIVIACFAAVVTGVVGGVMRDILCDRIPLVFSAELYGSIALIAGLMYSAMHLSDVPENTAVIATLLTAFTLRVVAIYYNIALPVFEYQEREIRRDPAGRFTMWVMNKAGVRRKEMKRRTVGNVQRRQQRRARHEENREENRRGEAEDPAQDRGN